MIGQIRKIHGSSSGVLFECENRNIIANGEFFAESGMIAGFAVLAPSLRYENGGFLTPDERQDLIQRYEEYMLKPHALKNWKLRFEENDDLLRE